MTSVKHDWSEIRTRDVRWSRKFILELRRNLELEGFPVPSFKSDSSGGSERGLDLPVIGLPRGLASCVEEAAAFIRKACPSGSSAVSSSRVTVCDSAGELRPRSQ